MPNNYNMKKVRVFIVEDKQEDATIVSDELSKLGYEVVGVATSKSEAFDQLPGADADILILDIYLGGTMDGVAIAHAMNEGKLPQRPFIFLTSATDKSTFSAARITQPHSYLIKPFNPLELNYAIELAVERMVDEQGELTLGRSVEYKGFFFVRYNGVLNKVSPTDITFVKVEGKYCELHLVSSRFVCRKPLNALIKLLPAEFFQVHRNYLLNTNFLSKIDVMNRAVYLTNGEIISASGSYLEALQKHFPVIS